MSHLKIKFVSTPQELEEAQRLRYQVFACEIKKNSSPVDQSGIDHDEFDQLCDHLIIKDTAKDMVVGTYRLLLDTQARRHHGFYTESKFNIDSFKLLKGRLLEVGRSCVHKDYRSRTVLNLLWQGIAKYVMVHRVQYLFGSVSIMTQDPEEIGKFFNMFKHLGLFDDRGIRPVDEKHVMAFSEKIDVENPKAVFHNLPVLFKGYMHIGLKVCGHPARGDFETAVFPILLDIKNMNPSYKRRFLNDYLL